MAPRLEDEVDRLYALPLEEFTSARNELAKRAPKEERERIRALRKPALPVWAANQLARREPGGTNALLRAGARLRETQAAALAGKGAESMRDAAENQRRAARELVEVARDRLGLADAQLERLGGVLRSASVDEQARELLRAGRLTEEVEPTGFEALSGMPVAKPKPRRAAKPKPPPKPKRDREREQRLREASAEVQRLERELERARRRLDRLTGD